MFSGYVLGNQAYMFDLFAFVISPSAPWTCALCGSYALQLQILMINPLTTPELQQSQAVLILHKGKLLIHNLSNHLLV